MIPWIILLAAVGFLGSILDSETRPKHGRPAFVIFCSLIVGCIFYGIPAVAIVWSLRSILS